ncbi:MAG: prepilin-type N-terminal cleavage/methylation domain-containing protein [Limisphaerales bacterium]
MLRSSKKIRTRRRESVENPGQAGAGSPPESVVWSSGFSRSGALGLGSAPASGAVVGALARHSAIRNQAHHSVCATAFEPTGEGAGRNTRGRVCSPFSNNPRAASVAPGLAFSLIELLVVIAIIGVLATIGLPALRGFGQSNIVTAANRQMIDDLWLARALAIKDRTTVYMVFIPPTLGAQVQRLGALSYKQRVLVTNLLHGQYTTYALLAARTVGDQPGRERRHYLTRWKALPEGMFIATNKFRAIDLSPTDLTNRPFAYGNFPFPTTTAGTNVPLPYIAFNSLGQLVSVGDQVIIPLARGSIFYQNDIADVLERPRGNHTNNLIAINWLTGRATGIKPEIK